MLTPLPHVSSDESTMHLALRDNIDDCYEFLRALDLRIAPHVKWPFTIYADQQSALPLLL